MAPCSSSQVARSSTVSSLSSPSSSTCTQIHHQLQHLSGDVHQDPPPHQPRDGDLGHLENVKDS